VLFRSRAAGNCKNITNMERVVKKFQKISFACEFLNEFLLNNVIK